MSSTSTAAAQPSDAWFVTTRWSVVLSAQDRPSPHSAEALEALCRIYWNPLYAYVRHRGYSGHDAQDLTQAFFARLLEKDFLHTVAREKGKFRTFLLVALKRFLANEYDRANTLKRGGGHVHLSLDATLAESRYQEELGQDLSAEKIFERRWAVTLLEQAMARLRQEFVAAGKPEEYDCLKEFLTADKGTIAYPDVAARLGLSEGAARVAVHRLRHRFRRVFREEIAQTLSNPEEIEEEVRYFMSVLSE